MAKWASASVTLTPYYDRWIAAFANIAFQKGLLTPEELAVKMDAVEARWASNA
ncbi:hypothetical protein [Rhizobium rhizogenes]|uniref:hypothetical protein n=1 Tax=Rhizobium rhizogenes TaxID=359 RepID=UPI0035AC0D31